MWGDRSFGSRDVRHISDLGFSAGEVFGMVRLKARQPFGGKGAKGENVSEGLSSRRERIACANLEGVRCVGKGEDHQGFNVDTKGVREV